MSDPFDMQWQNFQHQEPMFDARNYRAVMANNHNNTHQVDHGTVTKCEETALQFEYHDPHGDAETDDHLDEEESDNEEDDDEEEDEGDEDMMEEDPRVNRRGKYDWSPHDAIVLTLL